MNGKRFDPEHWQHLKNCLYVSNHDANEGSDKWNSWVEEKRNHNSSFWILLDGVDLSRKTLKNYDFERAYLRNANFQRTVIDKARFIDSVLDEANFEYSKINTTIFTSSTMAGADFSYATIYDVFMNSADLSQCKFLLTHSIKLNLYESNLTKIKAIHSKFINSDLDMADLSNSYLSRCNFRNCSAFRTILCNSNISNSIFVRAKFEEADLNSCIGENINISGSLFNQVDLSSADFSYAVVDQQTKFSQCKTDDRTSFACVSISSARMEPSFKIILETNIRRMEWEKWFSSRKDLRLEPSNHSELKNKWHYKCHEFLRGEDEVFKQPLKRIDQLYLSLFGMEQGNLWRRFTNFAAEISQDITTAAIKGFWRITDYGSSSSGLWKTAVWAVLIFTSIYMSGIVNLSELEAFGLRRLGQVIHFSIATMVTLGFGGMNVEPVDNSLFLSWVGYSIVTTNLLTGYLLLAALVTRLGILFQQPGPGK